MSEYTEQTIAPTASMSGRRVDFGEPHTKEGLAWGIEVEIDLSDSLVRARFERDSFKLPSHITKIIYLDLAPEEALSPEDRVIRSKVKPHDAPLISIATPAPPGNPQLEKIRRAFNILRPNDEKRFELLNAMVSWCFGPGDEDKKRFMKILNESKGNTLVIVHGHSSDLSGMGEQYPDELRDEEGNIIQRKYNWVPIDDILNRYDDPERIAAIVLHGCNGEQGIVRAKRVPVFYPRRNVTNAPNRGFMFDPPGGIALPQETQNS
jgi:hypothetical protein